MGDIIYEVGKVFNMHVCFVLEGTCRMIEYMPVQKFKIGKKTTYKKFDIDEYRKSGQSSFISTSHSPSGNYYI